jgi:hypothetical protein
MLILIEMQDFFGKTSTYCRYNVPDEYFEKASKAGMKRDPIVLLISIP